MTDDRRESRWHRGEHERTPPADASHPGDGDRPTLTDRSDLRADGGDTDSDQADDEHLRDVPDGAGCTEIWEYLSERHVSDLRTGDAERPECRSDD